MKKILVGILASILLVLSFVLTACEDEKRYALTVNDSALLYENLNETYAAGEEVTVKVKIKPYEGVKVVLDNRKPLVKTKSSQDEYWQFTFEMPSHNATLDIKSYKGFDEPILYGFYLTFNDKNGEPIEAFNKSVDSKEAIADYAIIYWEEEPFRHEVISSNEGANVFADGKSKVSNVGYELEDTLYFTYELLDCVACVDWVYLDKYTQQIYSYGDVGYRLDTIGTFSTFNTQNLSDNRYNAQIKEYEEKFDSSVKINFAYLDYLTNVKILEYASDNQLLKSTVIDKAAAENNYVAGENCAYVVIEEENTVKSGDKSGETHYERTLINKSELGGGRFLKYPRGDGLISPVYFSVKWQSAV